MHNNDSTATDYSQPDKQLYGNRLRRFFHLLSFEPLIHRLSFIFERSPKSLILGIYKDGTNFVSHVDFIVGLSIYIYSFKRALSEVRFQESDTATPLFLGRPPLHCPMFLSL